MEIKEELKEIKTESDLIRQKLEEKQHELTDLRTTKNELDLALTNSALKQQASEFNF